MIHSAELGAQIAARYPLARYDGNTALAYSAAVTDGVFACIADRIADGLGRGAPVFAYEFRDRGAPAIRGRPDDERD